jgi:hypothetical protein
VAAGGTVNGITFPSETKITELGSVHTVTAGALTVPAGAVLVIPWTGTGINAKTLTFAAGSTLTYEGLVNIVPGGKLILATATGSSVAKLAGTGKITAGFTTISGAWDAVGTAAGDVTIESVLTAQVGVGAKITADGTGATGLKANAGAIITQNAGETNNLTIGAATEIDLGGTDAEVGVILLKNDTALAPITTNGKLTFTDNTSTIKTGNTVGAATTAAVLDAATVVSGTTAYTSIAILNLTGDGTNAKAKTTATPSSAVLAPEGKLVSLEGATAGNITGGGATMSAPDGRISALTKTEADITG